MQRNRAMAGDMHGGHRDVGKQGRGTPPRDAPILLSSCMGVETHAPGPACVRHIAGYFRAVRKVLLRCTSRFVHQFLASSDAVVRGTLMLNVSNLTSFLLHLPMHCGLQILVVHRNYDRQQRCLFILLSTMSVHWRTQLSASHWGLPHSVCQGLSD